ncbi:hypothetical protein, partial [Klebsiella pneumoniae]|uniref:hypothetical protein n=1 Tax=Klebsiella pneumoniae TaxID=573 RepID=UPI0039688675
MTTSAWAEANGYPRHQVYMVINGQFKGRRGTSQEVALQRDTKGYIHQQPPHQVNR